MKEERKMKNKKQLALFLFASVLLINTTKTNKLTANISLEEAFDFSRFNSLETMHISMEELIYKITGEEVSAAEKEYLKDFPAFQYEGKITTSFVSTSLENNNLTIHAEPYTYQTQKNQWICWQPDEVKMQNETKKFVYTKDRYECIFTNVDENEETFHITYKAEFILNKEAVNQLINSAYHHADYYVSNQILEKQQQKYQEEYQQYLQKKAEYEQYLWQFQQYQIHQEVYENYLLEKQLYDEQMKKYELYLKEYAAYQEEVKRYNDYLQQLEQYNQDKLAYEQYLSEKEKYDKEMAEYIPKYQDYLEKMEKVQYQLSAMELIHLSMTSLKRSLYYAILGDAVNQVLSKKNMLIDLGVNKTLINQAEDATIWLKDFLPKYFALKTEAEKYQAYKSNYRQIKSNLETLLRTLEKLYRDGIVSKGIEMMDDKDSHYKEKYLILLAQLVLVCNAIDDNPVKNYEGNLNMNNKGAAYFDDSWRIEGKSLLEILENDVDFQDMDGKSYPLISGYPNAPTAPFPLPEVFPPTLPSVVQMPIEPTFMEEPEKPINVLCPTLPVEKENPQEPLPPSVDENLVDLIAEYNEHTLTQREEYQNDVSLILSSTFTKNFRNPQVIVVEFYDDENHFLQKYETEYGSCIVYDGIIPNKTSDAQFAKYTFSYWEYADGERFDSNFVTKEGFLYPVFQGTELQKYEITWNIAGKEIKEIYEYGTMPIYKEEIAEKIEGDYYYTFYSWDKIVDKVTQNETYTAIFHPSYLVPLQTGGANIVIQEGVIFIDCTSSDDTCIDIEKILSIVSDEKITIHGQNWQVELSNTTISQLKRENIKYLDLQISDEGNYEFYYKICFLNVNNEEVTLSLFLDITFFHQYKASCSTLYHLQAEQEIPVRAQITESSLSSSFQVGETYHIYPTYNIVFSNSEFVEIQIPTLNAKYQEYVPYVLKILSEGIENVTIKITTKTTGEEVLFDENGFYMPDDDVYIIVKYDYRTYVVNFISDGEIISTNTYHYGDEVDVPFAPIKASDEQYEYTFIGWDKEISPVTGDIDYIAVYSKKEVVSQKISYKMSIIKILEIIGITFICLLALFIIYKIVKKRQIH